MIKYNTNKDIKTLIKSINLYLKKNINRIESIDKIAPKYYEMLDNNSNIVYKELLSNEKIIIKFKN